VSKYRFPKVNNVKKTKKHNFEIKASKFVSMKGNDLINKKFNPIQQKIKP